MRLCLLGHDAPSCYHFAAGPAVGATATITVSTFCRDDLWYSSATSAVLGLNIAALNLVTGMSDGAGGGGKSIAGAFHGHGIYSANNYMVNEQIPTKYRLAVPIKQQNLFIMVNFFCFFFFSHLHLPTEMPVLSLDIICLCVCITDILAVLLQSMNMRNMCNIKSVT